MKRLVQKIKRSKRRKASIRKNIYGTELKPRMSVFKSNKNIYIQVINDDLGKTLCSLSTKEEEFSKLRVNQKDAVKLGQAIGERLKKQKISTIVFDRNGNLYHGVIKAIADGARKAGIEF
jgi:large subunit ribosomal protein L18